MAGLVHPSPQFGFRALPVDHSPSPLNYAFGLPSTASFPGWQPSTMQSSHGQLSQQKTVQKRKHEDGDEDELMDRSPTPERRPMRRIKASRSRLADDGDKLIKDMKLSNPANDDGIDVGVLLASLPSDSLLPILTSLLSEHPSLKSAILSKIPKPTLATAVNALNRAAKKLRDDHPYAASSTMQPFHQTPLGNGIYSTKRPMDLASDNNGSEYGFQREQYILDRLRPAVNDYVSTALSYLRYFSSLPSDNGISPTSHKDEREDVHPMETFEYLSIVTEHLLTQSHHCQAVLSPLLLPRLLQEWMAWVDKVDISLKEGGMFGANVAQNWINTLDRYTKAKVVGLDVDLEAGFRQIRDRWLVAAGFLVGRRSMLSDPRS